MDEYADCKSYGGVVVMSERHCHYHYSVDPDSLEIGTPGKGGTIKIYGDFRDPETFRAKINAAYKLRKLAAELLSGGAR